MPLGWVGGELSVLGLDAAAVVLCKRFVDEGRVAAKEFGDGLIPLNEVGQKACRCLEERFAEGVIVAGECVGGDGVFREVVAVA